MLEFAKMIYKNWTSNEEYMEKSLYFDNSKQLLDKLEDILSLKLYNEIYDLFINGCYEIEETAFIEGFSYACKCLSNGKIELNKKILDNNN